MSATTALKVMKGDVALASIKSNTHTVSLVVNKKVMNEQYLQLLRCAVLKVNTSQGVHYVSLGKPQRLPKRPIARLRC